MNAPPVITIAPGLGRGLASFFEKCGPAMFPAYSAVHVERGGGTRFRLHLIYRRLAFTFCVRVELEAARRHDLFEHLAEIYDDHHAMLGEYLGRAVERKENGSE